MANIAGKKILILGAGDSWNQTTEIEVVRYAHDLGLYVITTDSQTDWDLVPAKKIADEGWDISWSDVDLLACKCKKAQIDGIFAGFSEKKVSCAAKLSSILGLPFYTEGADLGTLFDKTLCKKLCLKSNVDVPSSFNDTAHVVYPVVVKPADNAGGRGIVICHNNEELEKGVVEARKYSNNNLVEIEEYIKGDEVFIYYIVENGVPTLLITCDLLTLDGEDRERQFFAATRYPSKYTKYIEEKFDSGFKKLINNLNVKNGFFGVQCFATEGRMAVHDLTFRIDGTDVHEVLQLSVGTNAVKTILNYSLTGSIGEDSAKLKKYNYRACGIFFTLGILLHPGTIAKYEGLSEVERLEGVYSVQQVKHVGETMIEVPAPLAKISAQIKIKANDNKDLEEKIMRIFDLIVVEDERGNDMVVRPDINEFIS